MTFLFASASMTTVRLGDPLVSGWPGIVLAVTLLAGPVALTLYHSRTTDRRKRCDWSFAILRLLSIGIVWALAVFDPILVDRQTEETPSQTLIAVDLSSSMDATDPQRSLSEKLRLAGAIGLAEVATVKRWLADIERDTPPAAANEVANRIDRLSRRDICQRLLGAEGANLTARLEESGQVKIVGFHRDLVDGLSFETLSIASKAGETWETDLGLPLKRGLALAGDTATKTLGVIVLSDGQHNVGSSPIAVARELRVASIPVFAVPIGSRTPPRDVAVTEVAVPALVFKEAEATVEAKVRIRGMSAQEVVVELFDAGPPRRRLERKTIAHTGVDSTQVVRFPIAFADLGLRRLEVVATPTGQETEVTTLNNTSAALTRVTDEKIRVLIVDEEVRWDTNYLIAALGRDKDIDLERIILDPPRLKVLNDAERAKASLPADRWPAFKAGDDDPLWAFDVIVLGDVSPRHLAGDVQVRLERFVAEREGTLIVQVGKRHFAGGSDKAEAADILFHMLPVDRLRPLHPKAGFQMSPTEAGWRLPFMALDDAELESRRRWSELPPLYWAAVGTLRPGATALAQALVAGNVKPLDKDDAIVALWNVGLGKVVWLGVDGTWRWRYRAGDRDHQRFWGQLVRWAGSATAGHDSRRGVTFGSKKPAYLPEQSVEVFLNLAANSPEINAATAKFRIVQIDDAGKERSIQNGLLQRRDERRRAWEGKAAKLGPGTYRVVLDVPELEGQMPAAPAQRDRFTIAAPESGERSDLATNIELLRALATESGGRLIWPDEVDQLPNLLRSQTTSGDRGTEQRLTRDPPWVWWILGIVLGLLTIEWAIRQRRGLP